MNPEIELRSRLLRVDKPARYIGGEYGIATPYSLGAETLRIVLCFPDAYEIGMSNLAVRMLYDRLNALGGIACERVFAPSDDMERVLREEGRCLFSLETGTPIKDFDIIAFSIGYELLATNVLLVLDLGGVPYRSSDRGDDDPVVIAGGPALTNPVPWDRFLDAVCIGEVEPIIRSVFPGLAAIKKDHKHSCSAAGTKKRKMLELIASHEQMHVPVLGDSGRGAVRGVDFCFGKEPSVEKLLPVPNIKTVQDHGVIEIMRGCGNACRFCHAGYYYRPRREKEISCIIREAESLVEDCGYREITLSSLSTGDYGRIDELLITLNDKFGARGVSFSLPSLRIDSFTLDLLGHVSSVRKSGLTFAVETPLPEWQAALNKAVPLEKTLEIVRQAKKLGWKQAKFYFMIGLPLGVTPEEEADKIVEYLLRVQGETRMFLHVNIGTFVPKPHTPFERDAQMDPDTARNMIFRIKDALGRRYFKISYHDPFLSLLEGMISRGDEKAGELIERGYEEGARFDAWEDKLSRDVWSRILESPSWNVVEEILKKRNSDEELPWSHIRLRSAPSYLKREKERAVGGEYTAACTEECSEKCGVCGKEVSVTPAEKDGGFHEKVLGDPEGETAKIKVLFLFSKKGKAQFLSHLNIMTIFERALQRAGIFPVYSAGYNPKPKLEFAQPLPLGIESEDEAGSVEIFTGSPGGAASFDGEDFSRRVRAELPEGISVLRAQSYPVIFPSGKKPKSLMASFWGGEYLIRPSKTAGTSQAETITGESLDVYRREHPQLVSIDELFDEDNRKIYRITLASDNTKAGNIKTLLEECTGVPFLEALADNRVTRSASFARYEGSESASSGQVAGYLSSYIFRSAPDRGDKNTPIGRDSLNY